MGAKKKLSCNSLKAQTRETGDLGKVLEALIGDLDTFPATGGIAIELRAGATSNPLTSYIEAEAKRQLTQGPGVAVL